VRWRWRQVRQWFWKNGRYTVSPALGRKTKENFLVEATGNPDRKE
jgi:hypothetical protein